MLGYNIKLTLGGKTILGRTQDDLTIAAKVKESITKDDAGVTKRTVTGHDVSFSVSALVDVTSEAGSTKMTRDDVLEAAMKTGASAVIAVSYVCEGGDTYGGNAIITGYKETSNASDSDDATFTLDLQVTGAFTKTA